MTIKLTQTVQKGGCAAKVAASELKNILTRVKFPKAHRELLVDASTFDDAAIYRVNDEVALVQTLDFFTPIVDSPRRYGAIAATNALSDVYAMGGRPKTAMGILAFPLATMTGELIAEVLQGASDKIEEAGANFVGGHSIDDDTLKFGLSVTGYVHPDRVWKNGGARPGDALILTKALGTGALTAGLKRGAYNEDDIGEALDSMSTLNNAIDFMSDADRDAVHGATDVTGFGLIGHAVQMSKASGCSLEIHLESLPRFELLMRSLESGFLTKAHRSNFAYTEKDVDWGSSDSGVRNMVCDPQTSGGLLLAVAPERASALVDTLKPSFRHTRMVGRVVSPTSQAVLLR